jgi:fumarate reductase flavoprotein subunit
VHGANRLGGNGVANSTVFGALAGDAIARQTARSKPLPDVDRAALDAAQARAFGPLGRRAGDLTAIRRALYDVMWNDVGILRSPDGLARGRAALDGLWADIARAGTVDAEARYNLTWMDRLNLESLILVSRAICAAALARTDSRGAHFREDHPRASDLATSRYTIARLHGDQVVMDSAPVEFTRVRPGETLLATAAE